MDSRIGLVDRVQVVLVALYVPLSGIYWVPGVSASAVAFTKQVVFLFLFFISLVRLRRVFIEPPTIIFALAVCAVLALLVNWVNVGLPQALDVARGYVEPAMWLFALLGIRRAAHRMLLKTVAFSFLLQLPFVAFPVLANLGLVSNIFPPVDLVASEIDYYSDENYRIAVSAATSGFTASRTGWGIVVATSTLLFTSLLFAEKPFRGRTLLWSVGLFLMALTSITVTGARSGAFALVFSFALLIYASRTVRRSHKLVFLSGATVAFLAIAVSGIDRLLPEHFFRGFGVGYSLLETLNSITTGRVDSYIGGIENLIASPLSGVGPDASHMTLASGSPVLPHNLWLRTASESGLLVLAAVCWLTFLIARMAVRTEIPTDFGANDGRVDYPDVSVVVLCGLVLALVEPSVIIGSMNTNLVFWTAVWLIIARRAALSKGQGRRNGWTL